MGRLWADDRLEEEAVALAARHVDDVDAYLAALCASFDWSAELSGTSGQVDASGVWYNETISAGSPAEFGYCAER